METFFNQTIVDIRNANFPQLTPWPDREISLPLPEHLSKAASDFGIHENPLGHTVNLSL